MFALWYSPNHIPIKSRDLIKKTSHLRLHLRYWDLNSLALVHPSPMPEIISTNKKEIRKKTTDTRHDKSKLCDDAQTFMTSAKKKSTWRKLIYSHICAWPSINPQSVVVTNVIFGNNLSFSTISMFPWLIIFPTHYNQLFTCRSSLQTTSNSCPWFHIVKWTKSSTGDWLFFSPLPSAPRFYYHYLQVKYHLTFGPTIG